MDYSEWIFNDFQPIIFPLELKSELKKARKLRAERWKHENSE